MRAARGVIGLVVVLAASAACLPEITPPWVLEAPTVLMIRTEVVELGPYASPGRNVPADRLRAEPMPMDTFELTATLAGPEGLLDLADYDPQWVICSTPDCTSLGLPFATCPDALGIAEVDGSCRFPPGPKATITTDFVPADFDSPSPYGSYVPNRFLHFVLMASSSPEITTEECFEAFRNPEAADRSALACLAYQHPVEFGPALWFDAKASKAPGRGTAEPDPALDPWKANTAFHPAILAFAVEFASSAGHRRSAWVQPGGTLEVRPDDVLRVAPIWRDSDFQTDTLDVDWWVTRPVDDMRPTSPQASFRVPIGAVPFWVFAQLSDGWKGVDLASFKVVPVTAP